MRRRRRGAGAGGLPGGGALPGAAARGAVGGARLNPPRDESLHYVFGWLRGFEVVCLSHLPWQPTLFQRPHHWMSRFSRYCETAWASPMSFRRLWSGKALRREGLDRGGAWGERLAYQHVAYAPLSGKMEWSRRRTCAKLARAAESLLPPNDNARRIVWLQYPAFFEAAMALEPDLFVVDAMDPYELFARSHRTGSAAAEEALRRANVVLAGGRAMSAGMEWVGERLMIVPSGVESAHFERAKEIAGDAPKKEFVVGYAGSVDERIDWPLVESLAKALPEVVWEFAGPVRRRASKVEAPNIRYLGPIDYAALPKTMARWSVGALPFHDDELCRALSPTKIPEYLAAGLAVVATPLPDVVGDWGAFCHVPATPDAWRDALASLKRGDAPAKPDPAEAIEAASWDAKFEAVVRRLHAIDEG